MTLRIEDHMGAMRAFSYRVMRRMVAAGSVVEFDDILAECQVAWCVARDHWKEETGVPFLAFLRLGMRNHVNRWVAKEIQEHGGSHLELDATFDFAEDAPDLHQIIADRNASLPEEQLLLADRRAKQLARLSPRARLFVELIESPPKALVDIVNGLQARRRFARERGVPSAGAPKRVVAGLVFRFMDASRVEQTKILKELEATFNLRSAFAEMDGVKLNGT